MRLIKQFSEPDLSWLVQKLDKQRSINLLFDELQLVNALVRAKGTESKKGLTIYKRWYKDTMNEIERLSRDETVWERLKRVSKKSTIFDRLKASKRSS